MLLIFRGPQVFFRDLRHPFSVQSKVVIAHSRCGSEVDKSFGLIQKELHVIHKTQKRCPEFHMDVGFRQRDDSGSFHVFQDAENLFPGYLPVFQKRKGFHEMPCGRALC